MPAIHPESLFAHPQVAHLRELAVQSLTGRALVERLDKIPVAIADALPLGAPAEAGASYSRFTKVLSLPPPAPGTTALEQVQMALHEGKHLLQDIDGTIAPSQFDLVRAGVRNVVHGDTATSIGVRFNLGVRNLALRHETEAYLLNQRIYSELGVAPRPGTIFESIAQLEHDLGRQLTPDDIAPIVTAGGTGYDVVAARGITQAHAGVAGIAAGATSLAVVGAGTGTYLALRS